MSCTLRPDRKFELSVRQSGVKRGGEVVHQVVGDTGPLKLSGARHILLLIHGFNNTWDEAEKSFTDLIGGLEKAGLCDSYVAPDAIVRFQWPGDVAVGPFQLMDFLGYPVDIEQAIRSAPVLRRYLTDELLAELPNVRISIVAHSLGCRLTLELLKVRPGERALPIEMVALLAPAVPVSLVELGADGLYGRQWSLAGTDQMARTMLKFHSWKDMVLGLAFPAGEALACAMNIEPAIFLEAVGFLGDPCVFGRSVPCDDTHGEYWGDDGVAREIVAAIDPRLAVRIVGRGSAGRSLPAISEIAERQMAERLLQG